MTGSLRLVVLCPHFEPDTAPTGVVATRIVHELAARGHRLHVVTALPWYRAHRVEAGWGGRLVRRERTAWGDITRVQPFAGGDRRDVVRRAAGFAGFSALAGLASLGGRVDGVLAMAPPLTMGLTGWVTHLVRGGPLVFNVQDVFPDAAVRTGALTNPRLIALAEWLERTSYHRAAAVTVLSEDMRGNVAAKVRAGRRGDVRVIPNFVDTDAIRPGSRHTALRQELGIGDEQVVMYAGNVGFSQSLGMLVDAARSLAHVTFVVNGDGSALADLRARAAPLANMRFSGFQPAARLGEVLATADVHVVPLRAGLGAVSVPSKTYSILAAARPVVAAVDPGTEVPRILAASGAGRAVPPDDPGSFTAALAELTGHPEQAAEMGRAGRRWVEQSASPSAVAAAYEALFRELAARRG